jgi:hypothetical protein
MPTGQGGCAAKSDHASRKGPPCAGANGRAAERRAGTSSGHAARQTARAIKTGLTAPESGNAAEAVHSAVKAAPAIDTPEAPRNRVVARVAAEATVELRKPRIGASEPRAKTADTRMESTKARPESVKARVETAPEAPKSAPEAPETAANASKSAMETAKTSMKLAAAAAKPES